MGVAAAALAGSLAGTAEAGAAAAPAVAGAAGATGAGLGAAAGLTAAEVAAAGAGTAAGLAPAAAGGLGAAETAAALAAGGAAPAATSLAPLAEMGSGAEAALAGGQLATGTGAMGATPWWDAFTAPGGTMDTWSSNFLKAAQDQQIFKPSLKMGGTPGARAQAPAPPPGGIRNQALGAAARSLTQPQFNPGAIGGLRQPSGPQYSLLGRGTGDPRMAMLRMLLSGGGG